ncbi:MAG: PhoU domain-containing protein [Acidimicrobiales bacterium]
MTGERGTMANARTVFDEELEALRLQVEVLTERVAEAVGRARQVVVDGDGEAAHQLIASDDAIDEMSVSLTETCYTLLAREAPVASDLRLVVSIIRVLHTLERIGDLALRVAHAVDDQPLIAGHADIYQVLVRLADNVADRFAAVREGWASRSVEPLDRLDSFDPLAEFAEPLVTRVMALTGPDAVRVALAATAMGRSLDRIGDQTQIMACRLRYLVTGDVAYLADEVAW